jgi:microcystin-dependent protein
MDEPFLGMIALFGFDYAPRGWAACWGQLIPLQQNTALFALLGTNYGGNGVNSFGLPDLRGRAAIGNEQGPGLSPYTIGEKTGSETVTLFQAQLPAHIHTIWGTTDAGDTSSPEGAYPANTGVMDNEYRTTTNNKVVMNSAIVSFTGSGTPISIMQPYLAMNFCIALQGVFPARK